MALSPKLKEQIQRYALEYHLGTSFYEYPDHGLVGFHIEEAVYAPLYYGYGGPREYADRRVMARSIEAHILDMAPGNRAHPAQSVTRGHRETNARKPAPEGSPARKGH